MTTKPETKVILTKDSLVPIGLVILIVGAALWINTRFLTLQTSMSYLTEKVTILENKIDVMNDSQWTSGKMKLYIELLKASNKGKDVVIPDIPD